MRVLLLNQVFYPDVAATAQHGHDLAKHLVEHGHEVVVIASRSMYGEKGATLASRETVDGIEIHRVGRALFGKVGILGRVVDFGLFYVMAMVRALTIRRPDVAVCFTTPPFISLVGWILRTIRGTKWVYWVMDLYPDVAVACGVLKERSLLTRLLERVNRFCLRRSDRTVVLGRCMLERVREKGVDHGQVVHIGVWSDQSEIAPIPREENPYRDEWGIGDRFVVMYAGNAGLAHDVQTMLRAAEMMRDDDSVRFAFVGGGKKKAEIDRFVKQKGLTNCALAPYQPRERLDALLTCADVHIVSVLEGLEGMIVPCKMFGIMAAERPALYIGDASSEIARVIEEQACGVLVKQGDAEGLVRAVWMLRSDSEERLRMGRHARESLASAYDRQRACEAWRHLLEEVVGESRASMMDRSSSGSAGDVVT